VDVSTTGKVLVVAGWVLVAPWFGWRVYTLVRSSMPWQWLQGHTRARAVVFACGCGIAWPAALILLWLCAIPTVARWITAFLRWQKPSEGVDVPD
jgi:hypothetical protein